MPRKNYYSFFFFLFFVHFIWHNVKCNVNPGKPDVLSGKEEGVWGKTTHAQNWPQNLVHLPGHNVKVKLTALLVKGREWRYALHL